MTTTTNGSIGTGDIENMAGKSRFAGPEEKSRNSTYAPRWNDPDFSTTGGNVRGAEKIVVGIVALIAVLLL